MSPFALLFGVVVAVIVVGASVMYLIESPHPDAQIKTLLDAFWWTAATVTTVGYGDVLPITDLGRTVAIFYMFFGIGMAGVFITSIATRFYKRQIESKENYEDYSLKKLGEKMDSLEKQHKEEFKKIQDQLKKIKDEK
jgi:voltage-gated potassium channel